MRWHCSRKFKICLKSNIFLKKNIAFVYRNACLTEISKKLLKNVFRLTSEKSPLTKMPPPRYVSIEFKIWDDDFKAAAAEIFQGAAALQLAGYTRFKLTLQNFYDTRFAPFGSGSGPFGDAAVDFEYGHNWRS